MTTAQLVCLAAIAAITILGVVSQVTRPKVDRDAMIKAVTTAIIIARDEGRHLNLSISETALEVFVGGYAVQSGIDRRASDEGDTGVRSDT